MPTLAGNPGLVFRGYRIHRDSTGGRQVFAVYSGPQAAIISASFLLDASNTPYNIDGIGPRWELEHRLTDVFGETPSEAVTRVERLRYNKLSKPLINHPSLAELQRDTKELVRRIHTHTEELDWNGQIVPRIQLENPDNALVILAFLDLLFKGQDDFIVREASVIVTETSIYNHPWSINVQNVGHVFTTAQMRSDAELISSWAANLPQDGPDPSGYQYGWVKESPEIETAASDRSQLIREYNYGLWNSILYPPAS